MINTRYYMIKKIYPNYLLLFKTNKTKLGYRCYENDRHILNYIKKNSTNINYVTNSLIKNKINYILIDNVDIDEIVSFDNNMYCEYLFKSIDLFILDRIRACVFR